MSTYRMKTKEAARSLKKVVDSIAVIECENSAESDVAIFLDSSVTVQQYSASIDAVIHIIDVMKRFGVNDTRLSVSSFSDSINSIIGMGETYNKDAIKGRLNMIPHSKAVRVPMNTLYKHARTQIFNNSVSRQNAKKFLIIFTNGTVNANNKSDLEREKSLLEAEGVNIIAVGSGEDANFGGLIQLVTDTFDVFVTSKDLPLSNLDVLQSEFVYNKCDLKGE
ncbi:uncharacterized protein LOC128547167 [Mercenaria mercenaria]|uniref:uncharacterized protein LOC128547167 n=1 Tax=Mercenaria mercenaria TaxID=6596 RepID=UPI00234F2668|nr:uncharacterized protein LOC128547167 [Mercenaria mercenaria]